MNETCPICKHLVVDHTSLGCFWNCGCNMTGKEVREELDQIKKALDNKRNK